MSGYICSSQAKCQLVLKILILIFNDTHKIWSDYIGNYIDICNEWLSQFQAKESTDIPDKVYDKLILEIKKERIVNMKHITHKKIRSYLKKLKLNKYYEHIPHIVNRLNGVPPPKISKEVEEKLRSMFREIQDPFMKVCPKNRKNFLSYSYVLHKFVQILGLHELTQYFPLLKSSEKLYRQDIIFSDIITELKKSRNIHWSFIPSI